MPTTRINVLVATARLAMFIVLLTAVAFVPTAQGQDVIAESQTETSDVSATPAPDSNAGDSEENREYNFTFDYRIDCTDVKSQDKTGTCWSFATASFIESELMRCGKGKHNLSEMFIVKNIYRDKARNYVFRQGKANFSQGALAHDFIRAAEKHGLVPESVFSGKQDEQQKFDHRELESATLGFLNAIVKQPKLQSGKWQSAVDGILDAYLGQTPSQFSYQQRSYDPIGFAKSVEFRGDDYVSITSYTHHPFYSQFILEIPDNYSNGQFYNLPIDDVMEIIDNAIQNGFSVAWDGDVSEQGFSATHGVAVLPVDPEREDLLTTIGEEIEVDQAMRQESFLEYSTTDDHLMHLIGISRDQDGNKYYVVKNSWGEKGPFKGYLHMSESYVRLKTVSILLHKDAVPKPIISK